jgi:hypothetical protein
MIALIQFDYKGKYIFRIKKDKNELTTNAVKIAKSHSFETKRSA